MVEYYEGFGRPCDFGKYFCELFRARRPAICVHTLKQRSGFRDRKVVDAQVEEG
jgi:hypothetical protein